MKDEGHFVRFSKEKQNPASPIVTTSSASATLTHNTPRHTRHEIQDIVKIRCKREKKGLVGDVEFCALLLGRPFVCVVFEG